jgi:hypothetical protein
VAERPRRESKLRGMHPAERGHTEDDVALRPAVEVVGPAPEPRQPQALPRREKKVIYPTFSARIRPDTIKRLKLFAVQNDMDVQYVTDIALDEWLTQHGG